MTQCPFGAEKTTCFLELEKDHFPQCFMVFPCLLQDQRILEDWGWHCRQRHWYSPKNEMGEEGKIRTDILANMCGIPGDS